MGIVQSSHSAASIFPQNTYEIIQNDFKVIPNYSYTQQSDPYYNSNYTVLSHKHKSHFELQKYELFFNTFEEYQTYSSVCSWRNKSKYLVQARHLKEIPNNTLCGTFHSATLFLERIPIRASQITDIPLQEGLYLIYTSLLGFRKIFEKTGFFDISLDMICINKDAIVKVWLNSNLSKIYPQLYSINQNFAQTDFIYKILSLCEPLIDFDPITQKFTEFLKLCNFQHLDTPNKDDQNKFCKYSKTKQYFALSTNRIQTSNKIIFSFDKVIEYLQGYLNKHNLVIAREMKSIRDLFKIQQKIQYKQQTIPSQKLETEPQQPSKFKLDFFQNLQQNSKIKQHTKRINTKRTHHRLATDRSKTSNADALLSYKSQEYMKNIKQLKQPQLLFKRPPSVSYGFNPSLRKQHQPILSPPHASFQKQFYLQGRQRIKTTVAPNISFFVTNQNKNISNTQNLNQAYRSHQNFYCKNQIKQNNITLEKKVHEDLVSKVKEFNFVVSIQQLSQRQNTLTNKTPFDFKPISNEKQNIEKQITEENDQRMKKKTFYYAVEKQLSIDEEIAKDLDRLEEFQLA